MIDFQNASAEEQHAYIMEILKSANGASVISSALGSDSLSYSLSYLFNQRYKKIYEYEHAYSVEPFTSWEDLTKKEQEEFIKFVFIENRWNFL